MTISVVYLLMGIILGVLIKYEIDLKAKKKSIAKRASYRQTNTNESNIIKQCDDILSSIRSINESLTTMHTQQKKEAK